MTIDFGLQAIETLPSDLLVGVNGYPLKARGNRYGEQYTNQFSLDRLADEGSLFRVRNATQYTGVAQTANTTQDTTKPFLFFTVPATATKSMRLHKLWLRATAIASGQTVQNIDVVTMVGGSRSSAGTDYLINVSGLNGTIGYSNFRPDLNPSSILSGIWAGVPVTVLGTTPSLIGSHRGRTTTIPVVGDEYVINFGNLFNQGQAPGITPVGTTVDTFVKHEPACIVKPGCSLMVIPWAAGVGSAMSWEFDAIWSER